MSQSPGNNGNIGQPPRPGGMRRPPRPVPPRPDGAVRAKPRPLDALNVDLSRSSPPPRSNQQDETSAPQRAARPQRQREGLGAGRHAVKSGEMKRVVEPPAEEDIKNGTDLIALESEAHSTVARREANTTSFDAARAKTKNKTEKETRGPRKDNIKERELEKSQTDEYYALKDEMFSALVDAMDVSHVVALRREDAEVEIRTIINEIISIKGYVMSTSEQRRLVEDICDDVLGYGPLEPLLARDDIADIMVNGADQVFIETEGKIELTKIRFRDNAQLLEICQRMVSKVGRRVDEASPICDARLLDGSRVNVIAPPLSIDGTSLTIRKFKKDKLRMTDLIKFGSITPEAAKVIEIAAASRCNILISGGTGSGKTTLLNCLSSLAADDERIITCEDSAELQLQQPHVVRLETRPPSLEGKGEVTMTNLVKNCLRMRPERIIVGEVRGPEAFDLLQAMNTGHDGSMGTLHANSPREAISRLESMITMGGFSLPTKTIREMIVSAINIVVQAQRLRDGSRRITHITEIIGLEGDTVITQDLVNYKVMGEDKRGKLIGKHVSLGIGQPAFWDRARSYNREVELQDALASIEEDMS